MNYAIVKTFSLLEVIKLSNWDEYEWDDYSTVRSKKDNDIVWFEEECDAIEFMIKNFNKELINDKYFKETSIDGNYYIY